MDWDQALVLSRLDYCNSLLAGLPASAIKPLQRIQTAAARLVFNLPKSSHVTPLFRDLQRLPVAARITFKTTVPTYKAVNGTAPTHLRALVRPHAPARALRATTSAGRASKGRTAKSQLFSVLAPLWRTDLPADVRTAESETTCFHKRLKTTCSELTWTPLSLLPLLPLPNISRVKGFMSQTDQEKLIHAFISSRLDYCNGLLTGLPQKSIKQLQLIQNAAARNKEIRAHYSSPKVFTLAPNVKVLLLVYKSLNGSGPEYMSDILVEYKPSRALRSTDSGQIVEPRVQTKHGEAAFSCYAAQNWNKLPAELKSAPTVNIFKSRLKTLLFSSEKCDDDSPPGDGGRAAGVTCFMTPAAWTNAIASTVMEVRMEKRRHSELLERQKPVQKDTQDLHE
ncbi:hypothetical protein N1851_026296 [Merluccius polli]|uniref:Uncharacterized protein n=1 Tax=Merluccius polli TaxID=89951 RepID=A0AA47NT43_MERPO|nr:hypothetical protein N1851_026296 [Merluccius polli]